MAVASALTEVECLGTLDRLSRLGALSAEELAERRSAVYRLLEAVEVVDVGRPVWRPTAASRRQWTLVIAGNFGRVAVEKRSRTRR
jgi:hypothetical protein